MTDEHQPSSDTPKQSARTMLGQAKDAADTAATLADTANNAFSAIKWVAIAVVLVLLGIGGLGVYKIITAPAKAIAGATEGVSDAVKSGASSVKDGTTDLLSRLVIPTQDQSALDSVSDAAFATLTDMEAREPSGVKARAFRMKNFSGAMGQVCELSMNFGSTAIPVFIAADNKAYATAKSLGAKTDRLMRVLIRAEGDDIGFVTEWDAERAAWIMKWKASTLKKPLSDTDAEARLRAILTKASTNCR